MQAAAADGSQERRGNCRHGNCCLAVVVWCRRLLQMGVNNAELYNNIGLCCFYAQQYDMTFNCLMRALALATDDCLADVWYNIGHVALVTVTVATVAALTDTQ